MIQLDATHLIGKGSTRDCYQHPADPGRCIKIVQDTAKARKDQRREERYFRSLRARKVDFGHVAAYLEVVETNLGAGHLYELVRDDSGEISKNLAHYLVKVPEHREALMRLLGELGRYLLAQRIVTSDFRDHNILCQLDAGGALQKLVVIDGVCDPAGISVSSWIKPLAQRRVRRRWARGMARFQQKYPQISGWPEL